MGIRFWMGGLVVGSIAVAGGITGCASATKATCASNGDCGDAETCLDGSCRPRGSVAWSDITGRPPGLDDGDDGDDGAAIIAGEGLQLIDQTLSVLRPTIELWAKAAAYDTPAEISALLPPPYSDGDAVRAIEERDLQLRRDVGVQGRLSVAGSASVVGALGARTVSTIDASARAPGELVWRGSVPILVGEVVTLTERTEWQDLTGAVVIRPGTYDYLPALPQSVRRYRFTVQYTDNLACSLEGPSGAHFALARHDDTSTIHVEWNVGQTWAGHSARHIRTSPWMVDEDIATCGATFATGACDLVGKVVTPCAGAPTVRVKSVALEYYDCLEPCDV